MPHPMTFTTNANACGTSGQGYIKIEKRYLDQFFGPSEDGDGDKVIAEWCLEITDENGDRDVVTIYDWKNYDMTSLPDDYDDWHVGGNSRMAPSVLADLLTQLGRKAIASN